MPGRSRILQGRDNSITTGNILRMKEAFYITEAEEWKSLNRYWGTDLLKCCGAKVHPQCR